MLRLLYSLTHLWEPVNYFMMLSQLTASAVHVLVPSSKTSCLLNNYLPIYKICGREVLFTCNSVCCACISTELQDQLSSKQLPSHLQDLWERRVVHLNGKEADILTDLLIRYKHVFSQSPDDLGRTERIQHRINTGVAAPCTQPPRR